MSTIDFEASAREGRPTVAANVDLSLDQIRSHYRSLPSLLDDVAHSLALYYPFPGLRCVFFPQSGFHIALKWRDHLAPLELQYEGSGLEYRFHSNAYIYYKNEHMIELDALLRSSPVVEFLV